MTHLPPISSHAFRRRHVCPLFGLLCIVAVILCAANRAIAQYADWEHSGSMYILTTPQGANLPATASVQDFPLLVRLHRDNFPFDQADQAGRDIRFSADGQPLSYEIEQWDKQAAVANIWVRIPSIKGNARQEITMHWGKPGAQSESNGTAVFNTSNGYVGVWHLGRDVEDAVQKFDSQDTGTTQAPGVIGGARHFPGKKGVFCGTDIQVLPAGASRHSTQAWFRSDGSNGRIVAWGNEKRQGKVTMLYQSPPGIRMDCYFSDADARAQIPNRATGWTHAVHTYENSRAILYINGEKQAVGIPRLGGRLSIEKPARMWIGGWYNNYDYIGDIDEVRISAVARSAHWVRLEYENQKPMQTLVGPIVQDGSTLRLSNNNVTMNEGETITLTAQAGGAQQVSWTLVEGDEESVLATNRFQLTFDAGRVTADRTVTIRFDAVYADHVKSIDVSVTVMDTLPEPKFTLNAPTHWNGRDTIEIQPQIENLEAMKQAGVGELNYRWEVSGLATINDEKPGTLILSRAQGSGQMAVKLAITNGGDAVTALADVAVDEPATDAWVLRVPGQTEMPVEGQFYARDDSGQGTLHCKSVLQMKADEVFLRIFADGQVYADDAITPGKDGSYAFAIELNAALVKYRIELGTRTGDVETVFYRAGDILCGDAYIIQGQSNALATDTREESSRDTNEWVRSYGRPQFFKAGERENLWCKPVWKANNNDGEQYIAELGWWGMELANRLVKSQQVPIFILNSARGGTRIDQHQRNADNPQDLDTIYGRMLWRVKQARLTHGIRAILWHQGENDQGAAGPDGDYGWKNYQRYFVQMSADWKRDFPNVSRYYVYQIWPNACSMGRGNGDMIREVQRTLPRLYSNMDVLSTLGVKPPGGCHFPLAGWSEFASMIQPLIERDFYASQTDEPITPANLMQAYYTSQAKDTIALEFDQPIVWDDALVNEFRLDGEKGKVASGVVTGNVLTLKLKEPANAAKISYLDEMAWSQQRLLIGKNNIAALTFCNVPILPQAAWPAQKDAECFSYYVAYRNGKALASSDTQKPADLDAFLRGVKMALSLEQPQDTEIDEDNADFKNGVGIGRQIARFAEHRFAYLDMQKTIQGLGDGLANEKPAYTTEELNAAERVCSKYLTEPAKQAYPLLGMQAPNWDVGPWHQLPQGKASLDISDFKGKVLYIYCFQSWCPGCHKKGFPTLQQVSERYKDDEGVAFVTFQTVFEDNPTNPVNTFENLKAIAEQYELTMPFAQSGDREDGSNFMRAYKTRGTPWTVIVDKQGIIRFGDFHINPDAAARLIDELKAQ